MTLVLGWYFRHHALYVDEYESAEDAIRMIGAMADNGDCAPDRVEVWDDNGHRTIDSDGIYSQFREWDDAERAERAKEPTRKPVVSFSVKHADAREDAYLDSVYENADKAAEIEQRLRSVLGDRLIVQRKTHGE